jgi:hypothetical protein
MNLLKSKLFLLLVLVLVLSACSKREDKNLGIRFLDSANLYSDALETKVTNGKFQLPNGIPVVIMTVDSIPHSEIVSYANNQLDKNSKLFEVKKERENCLLILISKRPHLMQLRFGEDLRLESYQAGLSFGQKYLQYQENFLKKGNENGLLDVLSNLEKDLAPALELSRMKKIQKPFAQFVFNEISDIALPSDGEYTEYVFKPYSKLFTSIKFFTRPIALILINAVLLFLLIKLGQKLIKGIFGRKKKFTSLILVIWNIGSSFFFTIPFWGSVIFLSSFRMEDHLLSEYLGIPLLDIAKDSLWFSSYTQIWLAAIIAFIVGAVNLPEDYSGRVTITRLLYPNKSDFEYEMLHGSYEGDAFFASVEKGVSYAFFSLFMPRAISILLLFYFILKIPKAISGYFKMDDWRK